VASGRAAGITQKVNFMDLLDVIWLPTLEPSQHKTTAREPHELLCA
jgi:hypothetical protein